LHIYYISNEDIKDIEDENIIWVTAKNIFMQKSVGN